MPLFQKSVISKYLKAQNKQHLNSKWQQYRSHFLNPKIQENIRELKEESYQGGFIDDLFVDILGYTVAPKLDFNFVLEKKNVDDNRKADGARANSYFKT